MSLHLNSRFVCACILTFYIMVWQHKPTTTFITFYQSVQFYISCVSSICWKTSGHYRRLSTANSVISVTQQHNKSQVLTRGVDVSKCLPISGTSLLAEIISVELPGHTNNSTTLSTDLPHHPNNSVVSQLNAHLW